MRRDIRLKNSEFLIKCVAILFFKVYVVDELNSFIERSKWIGGEAKYESITDGK